MPEYQNIQRSMQKYVNITQGRPWIGRDGAHALVKRSSRKIDLKECIS